MKRKWVLYFLLILFLGLGVLVTIVCLNRNDDKAIVSGYIRVRMDRNIVVALFPYDQDKTGDDYENYITNLSPKDYITKYKIRYDKERANPFKFSFSAKEGSYFIAEIRNKKVLPILWYELTPNSLFYIYDGEIIVEKGNENEIDKILVNYL